MTLCFDVFYQETVALHRVETRSFAEVGFCFTSSAGMVFTTIDAHGGVICFPVVRSTPTPHGFVLQIFDGANFLVAEKEQRDTAERSVWANSHCRVRFKRKVSFLAKLSLSR